MRSIVTPKPSGGLHIAAAHWIKALTVTPWITKALNHLPGPEDSKRPRARARVLAVFDRSCYAGLGPDLLLCLARPEIGCAPLNLLLDLTPGATFEKLGLQKGDPFERDGAALRLGPLRILLGGAKTWNPVRPVLSAVDAETLPRRMEWLSLELEAHHDAPGLGRLTPLALDETASDPLPALAARALPFALSFSEGLDKDNCALLREGAQGLVGLGPGLTPAGDDFLGGWLTALRSAEGWGFSRDELNRAAGEVRAAAAGRTTVISEALLGCALDGASSESVHDLLNVLLPETGGSGPDVLARAVREVSRRGHSSGWDTLAGIAWGLRSLLDRLKKANARPEIQPSGSSAIR